MSSIKELRTCADYAGIYAQLAGRVEDLATGETGKYGYPVVLRPHPTNTFIVSPTEIVFIGSREQNEGEQPDKRELARFVCKAGRWMRVKPVAP